MSYNKDVSQYEVPILRWGPDTYDNTEPFKAQYTFSDIDPEHYYKILSKLQDRVYGSGWDAAVFFAEAPMACEMIRNAATRLGAAVYSLLRHDPKGVGEALNAKISPRTSKSIRDTSKDASGTWLELQYGWKPLLSDAEEAAKYLGQASTGFRPGRETATRNFLLQTDHASRGTFVWYSKRVVVGGIRVAFTGSPVDHFLPDIVSVPQVLWEKLPYSFVADWFVPIGSYLDALKTSRSLVGQFIRTTRLQTVWSGEQSIYGPLSERLVGLEYSKRFQFQREVLGSLTPPPPLKIDSLREALSPARAANAVALLVQRDWSSLYKKFKQT